MIVAFVVYVLAEYWLWGGLGGVNVIDVATLLVSVTGKLIELEKFRIWYIPSNIVKAKLALLDLILTVIFTFITVYQFKKISKIGFYLLLPYLIWICFALYLNFYIVLKNKMI